MHGVFGYNPPPGGNLQLKLPQPLEWMFQPCEGPYEPRRKQTLLLAVSPG